MADRPHSPGRRRFLVVAGIGAVAAGAPLSWRRWEATRPRGHVPGPPDDSPYDVAVFETLIEFLGAYFDVELAEDDVVELSWRLAYAVNNDSGWRAPYADLAWLLDDEAEGLGAARFADASPDQKLDVIRALADVRDARIEFRVRSFLGDRGGQALDAQQSTIPQLLRLYRHSGVPWRQRGYATWPGVAGDPRAYTRPPGRNRC